MHNAQAQVFSSGRVVSTDPPTTTTLGTRICRTSSMWLRRSLKSVFPDLFATLAVPKAEELVATPYRHGSKEQAEAFFLGGMTQAMHRLAEQSHPAFPVSIYYAFKQSETESSEGTASTGWGDLSGCGAARWLWRKRNLADAHRAVQSHDRNGNQRARIKHCAGMSSTPDGRDDRIAARVPVRAKAHSPAGARRATARQHRPVDLAQASIGPGMAVFTNTKQS